MTQRKKPRTGREGFAVLVVTMLLLGVLALAVIASRTVGFDLRLVGLENRKDRAEGAGVADVATVSQQDTLGEMLSDPARIVPAPTDGVVNSKLGAGADSEVRHVRDVERAGTSQRLGRARQFDVVSESSVQETTSGASRELQKVVQPKPGYLTLPEALH